ncbi:MAG: alpha-L-fucosidase [Acidobacteriaceae bacterium]|nr:alpha-L-fucosidase [Acidobacteriaceae bacterium]
MRRSVCATLLASLLLLPLSVPPAGAQWAPMVSDSDAASRIAWWRDAKFGLFLHWGVYSIPGRGEWVQWNEQIPVDEYAKLAQQFKPTSFDPEAWAAVAKDAGMKYTVLTARHHDGFALFDDPGSSFTAMKAAAHRDFVADYVAAVRKAGLHVGLYYSPLDWRYPGFFFPDLYKASADELREQYHRQLHELASHYGKLDIVWFDGGGADWLGFGGVEFKGGWHARPKGQDYTGLFSWKDEEAVADLRQSQPAILVNDRTDAPADFRSREGDGAMGDFDNRHPWELCTTITEGAWGYQPNAEVKSFDQIIKLLVGAVGHDGNLLLNVGPRPDGQIEPAQAQRLKEVGDWLKIYGQSIYATRGGPYMPGDFGVSTYHDRTIYLHILNAPNKILKLPALSAQITGCSVLTGGKVNCAQTVAGVDVSLTDNPSAVDTIVAISISEPASSIRPIRTKDEASAVAPVAKKE